MSIVPYFIHSRIPKKYKLFQFPLWDIGTTPNIIQFQVEGELSIPFMGYNMITNLKPIFIFFQFPLWIPPAWILALFSDIHAGLFI
jgi:hypothetical protein